MTRDELTALCLAKPGAYLDSPFGEEDGVAKVGGKIFCFLGAAGGRVGICVKNERDAVLEWRTRFPEHAVVPRYLKKDLWNQVWFDGDDAPDHDDARELIDISYDLVVAGLPRARRPS